MIQRKVKHNQIDTLHKYICLYKYRSNRVELETVLKSSPSYPSLLAVYHSLEFTGIQPIAVRTKPNNLYTLNRPCLLHIKNDESEYLILVKCINENHAVYYDTYSAKFVKRESTKLLSQWDGVIIYTEQKECYSLKNLFWILGALISFVSCLYWNVCLLTTNLWGLFLSSLLMLHENEIQTSVVEGICRIGQNFDCNKVTQSKASRIFGVPLSVWGCFYFLSMIIFLLMSCLSNVAKTDVISYIQMVGFGCLPILVYSVIKQLQLGKWCILCLSITAILLFEVVLLVCRNGVYPFVFTIQLVMLHLLSIVIAVFFLLLLVKGLSLYKKYVSLRIQNLKLKRNPEIMQILFQKTKILDLFDSSYLSLGNTQASVIITTWLSPYCMHCSRLVKDMLKLYARYSEVMEWRIYMSGYVSDEWKKNEVQYTLMAWYRQDKSLFLKALEEWFLYQNLLTIKTKNMPFLDEVKNDLAKQISFTDELGIRTYPYFFINGRELPSVYTVNDLFFMINNDGLETNFKNNNDKK